MRKPWGRAAIVLFTACLLVGGLWGDRLIALTDEAADALRVYTELVSLAHESYGEEIEHRELVYASIEGMLRTLDPHTSFLEPRAYDTMRERQQESFYGLGIFVSMRSGRLTVIAPMEGTPASRLGLRAGDVIDKIEGESTASMTLDEAIGLLKGPKGTSVHITILRRGFDEAIDLDITRDEIPQTTVRYAYMIEPDTGLIALSDFTRSTSREMSEAIARLREEGMERLLLDLRFNGGGLLDQAVEVADQFVPAGAVIVETRGRARDSVQEYLAPGDHQDLGLPLVVLVNSGTASAAEILAGAVQDHDLGLIVGTPTWGKGLVQTVYSLSYGAGLALTTAKYYTPSGRLIQRDYSSWYDYQAHAVDEEMTLPGDGERFLTDLGRTVYGGGGITPDVQAEPSEIAPFLQFLHARNTFFLYAVEVSNRQEAGGPDWRPGDEVFDGFVAWLMEEEIATEGDLEEAALGDEEAREYVLRQIHAEVANSRQGLAARHRILAEGDPQIRQAVAQFERASDLLVARQRLEREGDVERTASRAAAAARLDAAAPGQ